MHPAALVETLPTKLVHHLGFSPSLTSLLNSQIFMIATKDFPELCFAMLEPFQRTLPYRQPFARSGTPLDTPVV
jgi:hypothetical protein